MVAYPLLAAIFLESLLNEFVFHKITITYFFFIFLARTTIFQIEVKPMQ
jgi:hypothetical protein